ncbi:MAG TPA: tripartite tricarboxylate transporter substrate binding protein [Burkholderiaceae bacterium]|jgi:tripartite-type tricarboxylate transporter receptor subunit TctC|nr:tripartite tricarboxylate transporter substrate binding protein [Rhodoferax sp.]MBP6494527.1 tripartite tricarboxylate transporter substrate binding protein [Rhodoferax sp.]MBP8135736.1 tripartite tricarboxylate transporter substrate binding protein [Rhodoferax sp.]HNW01106.1 tripartite tricarboxylate transporter substrate binding protein [Burkholderiaceae bacterium]HPW07163.1 tripartite tricarboxylate transporter substrate binding protein [Burkholderiaceae bacterium]
MSFSKRSIPFAAAVALAVAGALPAHAQSWPEKGITIVVPTAAGGANDAMARIIGQGLSARLGKPVIVENKAGANGAIASEFVARAAPDGYTIMFGYIATHGINPALQKLRYDPVADFEPIGMVAASPTVLVVNNAVPAKNVKELVQLIKAKPDSFSYATAGNGTAPHIAGELFKLSIGLDVVGVPYKGSAPAVVDTIGGTTQYMFPSLFTGYPQVKGGKLRALGIAGEKRSRVMPELPTLTEQGVPNVNLSQWYAMFAPAKTPKAVIDRLNMEMNAVLNDKATEKKIEDQGAEVETGTPDQLKTLVQKEVTHWKSVVTAAKIKID